MSENQYRTDLEYLLMTDQVASQKVDVSIDQEANPAFSTKFRSSQPLKANKSANHYNFIEMVGEVVSKALREQKVEFVFDEGKRIKVDPNERVEHPYITYKIIERSPILERKPRERESVISETTEQAKDGRQGSVYGQKFKVFIQFNIIASEYKAADEVMNIFEDLIFSYTHYFKKNGVAEILFEKHLTDKDYDIYRQNLSVRNLVYYVEIEKLYATFDSSIADISIK